MACEQKTTGEKWKFGSNKKLDRERTMSELGKSFRKSDPKNRKNPKWSCRMWTKNH